jgi:hypothetical protein
MQALKLRRWVRSRLFSLVSPSYAWYACTNLPRFAQSAALLRRPKLSNPVFYSSSMPCPLNPPRPDGLWKSSYSPTRPQRGVRMNLPCPDGLCGPSYSPSRRKRRVRMNLIISYRALVSSSVEHENRAI